jgi:hypothetical protein
MVIICSLNGVPIRLTEERWLHIISRHSEMRELRDQVLEIVTVPEMI